eukprot:TRINITY_DN11051_c0_g1_i1.p2 TRINITY_DN11051_c0_g1~~TRINITY_DN11051_c0_g1_i1.p2  ORF type:complete len:53 (-),score=7.12 TRINITY_DN11051_c0_g1_i1:11-169(-)
MEVEKVLVIIRTLSKTTNRSFWYLDNDSKCLGFEKPKTTITPKKREDRKKNP